MKYYFLYRTVNLVNGKFYVGVHSTNDICDDYIGSGVLLKRAIKRYGIDNFRRDILLFFSNENMMYNYESCIVNDEFILDDHNYNIARGGRGDPNYYTSNGIIERRERCNTGERNPMYGKTHSIKSKLKMKRIRLKNPTGTYTRTEETIEKLRNSLKNKTKSDDARKSMSKAQRNIKPQTCPHCGKTGTHNMKRYHFDNCKLVNPNQIRHKTGRWKGDIVVEDLDGNCTEYVSMTDAARKLKVDVHGISDHITNDTTYERGIYTGWKFRLK